MTNAEMRKYMAAFDILGARLSELIMQSPGLKGFAADVHRLWVNNGPKSKGVLDEKEDEGGRLPDEPLE
jgi:hypothetical protein